MSKLAPISQAVILAAGKGTRMQFLTKTTPKPMLLVHNKPLLAHTIEKLPKQISEVILVIGYLGEKIKEHFGNEYKGKSIKYVIQKEILGTGHALSICQKLLNERFLVINGDDVYDKKDIKKSMKYERAILVKEVNSEFLKGDVFGAMQTDKDGYFTGIKLEKLNPGNIGFFNTALYILDKHFFEFDLVKIKEGNEYGLPHTVVSMYPKYPVKLIKTKNWLPISNIEELEKARVLVKNKKIRK